MGNLIAKMFKTEEKGEAISNEPSNSTENTEEYESDSEYSCEYFAFHDPDRKVEEKEEIANVFLDYPDDHDNYE